MMYNSILDFTMICIVHRAHCYTQVWHNCT